MSFTTDIIEELSSLPLGKNCCRKALLFGLFYDGRQEEEQNVVSALFRTEREIGRAHV